MKQKHEGVQHWIFINEQGVTLPPKDGDECENYQVLGFSTGADIEEAKANLLKENPHIIEQEYTDLIGYKLGERTPQYAYIK